MHTETIEIKVRKSLINMTFEDGVGPALALVVPGAKDCPFCREFKLVHLCKKTARDKKKGQPATRVLHFKVRCLNCGARAGHGLTADEAVLNWQQRRQ